jgi:hypothetical protein
MVMIRLIGRRKEAEPKANWENNPCLGGSGEQTSTVNQLSLQPITVLYECKTRQDKARARPRLSSPERTRTRTCAGMSRATSEWGAP